MTEDKPESKNAPSRVEALAGRIFIWLILIIVPVVVIDVISPHFLSHRGEMEKRFPVQVVRQPKPYVMFGGKAGGEIENGEKLNGLGYRGDAPEPAKKPGEYRIIVLGGSTAFEGNPPIPKLVEEEFRKNGYKDVRVYNFGVVSSVSSMELVRLVFEVADYQPDVVVMYNGCNDIFGPHEYDPRPGYPFNYLVYEKNPLLESDIKTYPTLRLMLYGSNLARHFMGDYFLRTFAGIDEERKAVGYGSRQWQGEIADIYVGNIVKAEKVSAAFGAKFVVFFQPILPFKDHVDAGEQVPGKDQKRFDEIREHCLYVREKIRELVKERGAEGVFVDLSDIYDNTPGKVYWDGIHTYQEFKPIVAEQIYMNLAERQLVPRKAE